MLKSAVTVLFCLSSSFAFCQVVSTPFLDLLKSQVLKSPLQQSLTLNGTAEWRAGSTDESGPATFTARSDGSFDIDLALDVAKRKESYGSLVSRKCQRTDKDGVISEIRGANCITPLAWFSPSILPLLFSNDSVVITDAGVRTEGSNTRHAVVIRPNDSSKRSEELAILPSLAVTVLYDPVSILPSSLEYSVHPDSDDSRSIPVRIDFSDYRAVSGLLVPYRIDRYISGQLQLTVTADTVALR